MATIEISEPTLIQLEANAKARSLALDAYLASVAEADATKSAKQLAAIQSFAKSISN